MRVQSAIIRPWNPVLKLNPFEKHRIADFGDLPVNPLSIEDSFRRIERGITPILVAGARTLCVGGDHSISLPILRAISKYHGGPVNLIQFDAHNDLWDEYFGSKYSHGTPFRRAFEEGLLNDGGVLQVGLRGQVYAEDDFDFAREHKVRMVTAEEFHEKGMAQVKRHLAAFKNKPTYVTLDIDCVDPAYAPGTGTPQVGGFTSHQILQLVRALRGLNIIGCDLVEVSPAIRHRRNHQPPWCESPLRTSLRSVMATLARKLRLHDYFALAFGTMIGTGWLVLMDDWLGRGGPLGAILGFVLGGIVLLPVGYVYGQWVLRLPDAAGEAAYTAQVFPPVVSYFTGWIMLLAYFIVCPWEAIALGKIAAYIFPQLDSIEVYRVGSQPVFFWRLVLGVALTLFLTFLNYRGIRLSANFQKGMTSVVLLIFISLVAISTARGTPANLHPVFHGNAAGFDFADAANRAVFSDRLRVRAEIRGGSESRFARQNVHDGDRDGARHRRFVLCAVAVRGVVHRAVAEFARQALRDGDRV